VQLSFSLAPLLVLVLCACTEPGGYDKAGDRIGQEFVEVEALETDLAEKDEEIRRLKSAIRDVEDQLDDVIRDVQMASDEAEAQNWEDAAYLAQEAADDLKEIRDALP
jgi:predicted  nucleic acid-binding Zn-ribbon protein